MLRANALARCAAIAVTLGSVAWLTAAAHAQKATKANATAPSPSNSQAAKRYMNIQEIKSPGGITAWLVESHNVPLMALRFAFDGGVTQDPAGKEGLVHLLTGMMDEGAGDLTSTAYQEAMEDIAMRMSFQAGRDYLYGSLETLTVNREKAVELLRLALTKPRFDPDAVERTTKQIVAQLAFSARNPEQVAAKAWNRLAFADHPYGRPSDGTPETVASLRREDLLAMHRRIFTREHLKVVAVGDIEPKALGEMLDKLFGALPAKSDLVTVPPITLRAGGALEVIEMPVPQSVARFGLAAMMRKDPDFMAATVVNQILGGGGFASRLMEEVREKRGLAYSVYSYMAPYSRSGTFGGGVATKNSELVQSLDVIKAELKRMAAEGPTKTELENAKSYLVGSYALRFDTNAKIANELLALMVENLGKDYINQRNPEIEAVTAADAKRVAAKLLKVEDLIVTVVGKPDGLKPTAKAK
jgi:zinc protease